MSHILPYFRPDQSGSSHVCRVCAKLFRASSLLDIHMRVHVGAKPFACPICAHRATQKGNLKLHMKKHHGADLPPHIDLVPDSGIWGHPQEDIFCCVSAQPNDGFHNISDASGKRKQVTQAVSSLLDEEVVELIKRYQNDSGQGTAGTITESLEDFIRIAKNKSGADTDEVPQKERAEKSDRKKKRLALLRFQPYPKTASSRELTINYSNVIRLSGLAEHSSICAICGQSYSKKEELGKLKLTLIPNHSKLPVCQNCVNVQRRSNHLLSLHSMKKEIANQEESCLSENNGSITATINNAISEELHKKNFKEVSSTCEICDDVLIDSYSLKGHTNQCHATTRNISDNSCKEKFLHLIGLISEASRVSNAEKVVCNNTKHAHGLNPVIKHLMLYALKTHSQFKVFRDISECPRPIQNEIKQEVVWKDTFYQSPKTESDMETLSPIKRRASPGVLKMLRQTLMNSADRKEPSRRHIVINSNDGSTEFPKNNTHQRKDCRTLTEAFQYRNSAMESHAEIGKSLIFHENSEQSECIPKIKDSHVKNIVVEQEEHESNGYKCPFCPKWFKYRSVLEIHTRSHTGERPCKCCYGEYAGTQQNCLKLHIQRHHPTQYSYSQTECSGSHHVGFFSRALTSEPSTSKESCFSEVKCPVCGRVSPSPGYLKIHMRSHKKSLDHVCHVCGRGFKEYWYLTTHLKTHERELNSLKLNHQYSPVRSQFENISNSDFCNSTSLPNKFAANLFSKNGFPSEKLVNPRILKHDPTSTRHTSASDGNIPRKNGGGSYQIPEFTAPLPNNTTKTVPDDHHVQASISGSRLRRRKASCPSRVVSSPYVVPKSPVNRSKQSPPMVMETFCPGDIATWNTTSSKFTEELPLDLRCPAKKMSDSIGNDMPKNLCKM